MKAFRFPLEQVLNWRRMLLAIEESKIQAISARIERLDEQRRTLLGECTLAESEVLRLKTLEGHELARMAAFQVYVRNEKLNIARGRLQHEGELALQREKLLEAQRQVKLLDNVRSKRMARWTADVALEQEKFAGEAFLARWQAAQR